MTNEEAIEAFRNLLNDIDKDNHLFVGTINPELLSMAIDALKTQLSTESTTFEWIPVSERLPESQTNVLVSVHDTTGDTAFDYSSYGWITIDKEYWIVDNEICNYVIAWMPLPEPYTPPK